MLAPVRFKDRMFFITGGSEGIGLAIAKLAVINGGHVAIIARRAERLDSAIAELEKKRTEPNQRIVKIALDITDANAVNKAGEEFVKKFGCPFFIINCAGFARPGYLQDLAIEEFRSMMEVNYFGTLNVCKAFSKSLMASKEGYIVNVSSMAGFLGLFGYTGYCASKYAVVGFSEALKNELKPYNINVSILCPPNTRTPGLDKENEHKPAEVRATEEKVKVVNPEVVAEALFTGMQKKKFMILPTLDGSLAYYLKRLSPWMIEQFTKRPTEPAENTKSL